MQKLIDLPLAARECPASSDAMWTLSLLTASLGDVWNFTSGHSFILENFLNHVADEKPALRSVREDES